MTIDPPPPAWLDQDLALYHGTDERGMRSLRANGVSLAFSRDFLDFGRGFYMTTSRVQAIQWAQQRARTPNGQSPYLMSMAVPRRTIAAMDVLAFVRGSHDASDYWALVNHCRTGGGDHSRPGWYDLVVGPVSLRTFPRRRIRRDSDQLSFHTDGAVAILNGLEFGFERLQW